MKRTLMSLGSRARLRSVSIGIVRSNGRENLTLSAVVVPRPDRTFLTRFGPAVTSTVPFCIVFIFIPSPIFGPLFVCICTVCVTCMFRNSCHVNFILRHLYNQCIFSCKRYGCAHECAGLRHTDTQISTHSIGVSPEYPASVFLRQ